MIVRRRGMGTLTDQNTGLADDAGVTADRLFPGRDDRGGPLNWSAFAGFAQQAGLSGVLGTNLRRRR